MRQFTHRALSKQRVAVGKTLQDVADELDVSVQTVWSWEHGRKRPSVDKLGALADALEFDSMDALFPDATSTPTALSA